MGSNKHKPLTGEAAIHAWCEDKSHLFITAVCHLTASVFHRVTVYSDTEIERLCCRHMLLVTPITE